MLLSRPTTRRSRFAQAEPDFNMYRTSSGIQCTLKLIPLIYYYSRWSIFFSTVNLSAGTVPVLVLVGPITNHQSCDAWRGDLLSTVSLRVTSTVSFFGFDQLSAISYQLPGIIYHYFSSKIQNQEESIIVFFEWQFTSTNSLYRLHNTPSTLSTRQHKINYKRSTQLNKI